MLNKLIPALARKSSHNFEMDIKPSYPPIHELIERAEKCTESCVHPEQAEVSRHFFKTVAMRGFFQKRYSIDEAKRVGIIVDYIAQAKRKKTFFNEAII